MGTTATYAFPFPGLSDAPNGPAQVQALAEAVDVSLATEQAARELVASNLAGLSTWKWARKTGDTSRTNSTLAADPELQITGIASGGVYLLDGCVFYNGQTFALGPGDLKIDWSMPGGSTFKWIRGGVGTNNALAFDAVATDATTIRALGTYGTGTDLGLMPTGYFVSGGAGTLALRWAQNATTATATILRAGSWIRLHKIA